MVWLAAKMWILLLLAFLLGIFTHWLVNRRDDDELAYEGNGEDGARAISPRLDPVGEKTAATGAGDAAASDHDGSSDKPIIREYGAVPQKRTRIYESETENAETRRGRAGLYALPDLKMSDKAKQATDLDTVRKETIQAKKSAADQTGKPADLLDGPRKGRSDDLTRIRGIGPTLERVLKEKGIFHHNQIARWTPENVNWIEREIDFPGRVSREKWVEQAKALTDAETRSATGQGRPAAPAPATSPPAKASAPRQAQAETNPSTSESRATGPKIDQSPAKSPAPQPVPAQQARKTVPTSPASEKGPQTHQPASATSARSAAPDTGDTVLESAFDRILAERKLRKG